MPLPEIPELPRPEPPEAVLHPPPIRFGQHGVRIRQRQEGLDQQRALRLAPPIDAVGPCEIAQDLGGQVRERLLERAGRRKTSESDVSWVDTPSDPAFTSLSSNSGASPRSPTGPF